MADPSPSFMLFDEEPSSTSPPSHTLFDDIPTGPRPEDMVGVGPSSLPYTSGTLSDIGYSAMAGVHDIAAASRGAFASTMGSPESREEELQQARQEQEAAAASRAARTPGVEGGWSHPFIWAAEQAPAFAAYAGAEALGTAAAGPVGAAAVMGAFGATQQEGETFNTLTGEGIDPTTGELLTSAGGGFLGGALAGRAAKFLPVGSAAAGTAGKLAGDRIVNRMLAGGLGDSITFGAQSGIGEAVREHGEIRTGQRTDYDPGAIGGAALGGAEFGAAFGAFGGISKHKEQEGGGFTSTRDEGQSTDARKPEVRLLPPPGAYTKLPGEAEEVAPRATGPAPPPSPIVDPAIAVAARGEGATPAEKPSGAPPGAEEPAPVVPPAPTKKEAPAAAPGAPGTPPDADLMAQRADLLSKDHTREAVLFPPGVDPPALTKAEKATHGELKLDDGSTLQYDRNGPSKIRAATLQEAIDAGRMDEYKQQILQPGELKPPKVVRGRGRPPKAAAEPPAETPAEPAAAPAPEAVAPAVAPEAAPAPEVPREEAARAEAPVAPAAGEVAPGVTPEPTVASVPFMMTNAMRSELSARGLSDEHIANMTPAQAHEILATPPEAKALTVPAGAAETAVAEPRRVLEAAQTEAEKLRMGQAKRQEMERIKAEKKALDKAGKEEGKHRSKADLLKIKNNNKLADEVVAKHPRPAGEKLPAMHERLANMLEDARKSGVKLASEFGEGTPHSPSVMLLSEAHDLARRVSEHGDRVDPEFYSRYLTHEDMVHKGEGKEAIATRRVEGAERGALGSPEGVEGAREEGAREAEHELTPEEQLMRKEEEEKEPHDRWATVEGETHSDLLRRIEKAKAIARDTRIDDNQRAAAQAGVERMEAALRGEGREVPGESLEERMAQRRAESEELKKAEKPEVAPRVTPTAGTRRGGGAYAGFGPKERPAKVSLKREGVLKQEIDRGPGTVPVQVRRDQPPTDVHTLEAMPAREAISKFHDLRKYPAFLRPMIRTLVGHMVRLAGDVKVHIIDHDEMMRVFGDARGVYDPTDHQIFLSKQYARADTIVHELFHAVTHMGLEDDWRLAERMQELHAEFMQSPAARALLKMVPALEDPEEFLTNLMTKPEVQDALKKVKISDELARKIGIPIWRRGTIWNGVLETIRQTLDFMGIPMRDTSIIEAAMAISERAMHERFPEEREPFIERYAQAQPEVLFDPVDRRQNEEQAGGRYKEMGERAGVAAHDAMSGVKAAFQRNTPKFMNGVQLSRWFGKHFTDEKGNIIDHILTIGRRKGVELNEWRTKDLPIISRAVINSIKFRGSDMKNYGDLLHMSSKFNIDASKPPRDLKGKTFEVSKDDWQKNKNWAKAHEMYNSLPPELREQYNSERDFYRDKQKQMAEQHLNSILDNYPLPAGVTRDEILDRIKNNTMTDDDLEHYSNLKTLSEIHADQKLMKGDRVYFPAYRDGNYVVTGRYAMPVGGHDTDVAGNALPDNIREFDDREEAHKYVTRTHMHANVEIVRYAKDTGEKLVGSLAREEAADTARGGPSNVVERFEVTLQREHTEMHRSYADAQRAYDDMRENGVQELSGVLDKRKEGDWGKINSEFGAAMERRINDRNDLSKDQKKALIEEARNYALVRRSALQSHLVHRRYVAGADYGNADALRSYSEAANRHAINAKYAPELDAAMKRMEDQDNANRRNPDISYQSSTVANELRERAYRSPDALSYKNAPWVNRLMQLAYMHYMVGPRHLMMMQSHPYVYSAPEMAGRHGVAAYKALHDAARDLGGDFAGMREGVGGFGKLVRAAFKQDPEAAAQLSKMKDMTEGMLSRLKGDEREDMESMRKTGELHSGFDDEFYGASGMEKVNAMVRQLTSAQDAQNRAVVALSAYRLERSKGSSREEALAYSRRVVQDTIGVNSPMDMGSAMKNPMARMFMQFKHFPMRQLELMGRNLYNAFAHENADVKAEAWKAFAHQFTSSFAMAGVHGLPIGALKVLGVVAYGLGVGPSPAQWDDRTRRWLAGVLGSTGANVLMDGVLAAIPHAPNLNNMFSRDLDLAFGEPRMVGGQPDLWGYAVNTFLGAPASTVKDSITGVQKVIQGDWLGPNGGLSYLPAPRILNDIVRAQGLFEKGLTTSTGKQLRPASAADAAWRALGFGTQEAQRSQSGRAAAQADIKDAQEAQKLTKGAQLKAQAQAKRQQTIMGIAATPKTRQMLQQREELYQ